MTRIVAEDIEYFHAKKKVTTVNLNLNNKSINVIETHFSQK